MAEKKFFLGEKCFALALLMEMDKICPAKRRQSLFAPDLVAMVRVVVDDESPRAALFVHSENRVSLGEDQVYSQSRRELRQGQAKGFLAEGISLRKG